MSKLLFIWYKRSEGVLEGGGQCSQRNYNLVCNTLGKENIDSFYIHENDRKRSLLSYVRGVLYMPFGYFFGLTPKRIETIIGMAQKYDFVFIDRSVFGLIAKKLKECGYKGQIITHFHNVETVYFDAKISKKNPFRNILLKCVSKNDGFSCRYSDKVIALNSRDEKLLSEMYNRRADLLLPITLRDKNNFEQIDDLTSKNPLCLFLGTNFPANNEGLLWFVNKVLPKVNVHFRIVGKGMAKLKKERKELAAIETFSDVPDLVPFLQEADIMILPIFSGSGMKVKTCESLMFAKNIIGTQEAFEGYDLEYEKVGGICNTADDFVNCINKFIENPHPKWNSYSREMYLQKYSDVVVENNFRKLFD